MANLFAFSDNVLRALKQRGFYWIKGSKSVGMRDSLFLIKVFLTTSLNSTAATISFQTDPRYYLFLAFGALMRVAAGIKRNVIGIFYVVLIIGLIF